MISVMRGVLKGNNLEFNRACRGGFTILELMAVLAILAILAAIVVPQYTGAVERSKEKACDNNLKMLNHAAELYYYEVEEYPEDQQALVTAKYIKEEVLCPVDEVEYQYDKEKGVFTCKSHPNEAGD